jgi:hypothetical protein
MFSPFKMHEHVAFDEFYYTCILLGYYYIRIAVLNFFFERPGYPTLINKESAYNNVYMRERRSLPHPRLQRV